MSSKHKKSSSSSSSSDSSSDDSSSSEEKKVTTTIPTKTANKVSSSSSSSSDDSSSDDSSSEEKPATNNTPVNNNNNNKRKNEEVQQNKPQDNNKKQKGECGSMIKIFNLSFQTNDDSLQEGFKECGTILRANVAMRDGRSRGFAFIEFQEEDAAEKALQYNNTNFEGREIRVELAEKNAGDVPITRSQNLVGHTTRVICKNCLGLTQEQLQKAFEQFGEIKEVHVLSDKPVAFITYFDLRHAEAAFNKQALDVAGVNVSIDLIEPRINKGGEGGGFGGNRGGDRGGFGGGNRGGGFGGNRGGDRGGFGGGRGGDRGGFGGGNRGGFGGGRGGDRGGFGGNKGGFGGKPGFGGNKGGFGGKPAFGGGDNKKIKFDN